MIVRRWIPAGACAIVALSVFAAPAGADSDAADDLASRALAILAEHCGRCHGGPAVGERADRGGFAHILDPERMASEGQLERFAAIRSEIIERIRDREMPPRGQTPRPGRRELAVLEEWIAAGARPPDPGRARTRRSPISSARIAEVVLADLDAQPRRHRRSLRYISLAHLHNAGRSDAELDLARAGLAKLLASLSWSPSVARPVAIDPARTLFRIDLGALGWSAGAWQGIARRDPYAVAASDPASRRIRRATATLVPIVRGDWLVFAAARPPLYHELLGIPDDIGALERRLGVDRSATAARAGFNGSGVSRHNRVIERRARSGGHYYWRSFDFDGSGGRRNLFDSPIDLAADGGEIIFSLPNGMQAYMLINAEGARIDRAPTQIVVDPSRPDSTVENGISCMSCHSLGIIDKRDEVRAHVVANRVAFERTDPTLVDRALALYPPHAKLDALLAADRARFETALAALGAVTEIEPINFLAQRFEAELTLVDAVAELGVDETRLRRALRRRSALGRTLGSLLVTGGTVKRDAFALAFADAARELAIGVPLADAPAAVELRLECDAIGGRACYRAGNFTYHGRGVPVDRKLAAALYRHGCDGGFADACNALGYVTLTGEGVAIDRRGAVRHYRRACDLGSPRGCHVLGLHALRGDGTPRNVRTAVALLATACRGGRADACPIAADELSAGRRVRRDRARAASLYGAGCDGGNAVACRKLADQHLWGQGAALDWWRANKLYRRGCQLGDRRACVAAGDVIRSLH